MTNDLGVWKAEDCALVLIDYQNEMLEVIRSETNADLVELHLRLLAQAGTHVVDLRTVIAVLTHDPKFDIPVLKVAVRTHAAYIGAMGSRRNHQHRVTQLWEAGLTDEEIDRIHSPIGLDIGARTPEEIAVSICADIVQVGRQRAAPCHDRGTDPRRTSAVTSTAGA
jgi:xanthine/CO dehydrogenase XdhC/CoxF family maturation factor